MPDAVSYTHLDVYKRQTKFLLDDDQWVLLRFSGTEPLLRIFAEADSPAKAQALIKDAQKLLPM